MSSFEIPELMVVGCWEQFAVLTPELRTVLRGYDTWSKARAGARGIVHGHDISCSAVYKRHELDYNGTPVFVLVGWFQREDFTPPVWWSGYDEPGELWQMIADLARKGLGDFDDPEEMLCVV